MIPLTGRTGSIRKMNTSVLFTLDSQWLGQTWCGFCFLSLKDKKMHSSQNNAHNGSSFRYDYGPLTSLASQPKPSARFMDFPKSVMISDRIQPTPQTLLDMSCRQSDVADDRVDVPVVWEVSDLVAGKLDSGSSWEGVQLSHCGLVPLWCSVRRLVDAVEAPTGWLDFVPTT